MTKLYQTLSGILLMSLPAVASAATLDYDLNPEDGATVSEFYEIELDFGTQVTQDFDLAFSSTPAATLTGGGESYAPIATLSPAGNGILRFYSAPTEEGVYELWVAEGLFVADNGDKSPEIRATYTLASEAEGSGKLSYTLTPEDGATVSEFYEIELDFGTPVTQDFDLAFSSTPAATLTGGGESYAPIATLSPAGNGILRFYSAPTEEGVYELWVAEGLFVTDNGDKSPEIRATYTLASESSVPGMTEYELDPADGATVESLSKINIHFTGAADGIDQNYNLSGASAAKLTCGEKIYYPVAVTLSGDCESGVLRFETITEPGTYELWVAAGLFIDYETEAPSTEITATYRIAAEGAEEMTEYELDPADGEKVPELSTINIHFTGAADGIDQNYNLSGASAAKLTCGEKEYYPVAVTLSGDCESGVLRFETITEPGTYNLWVAAGLFIDYETEAPSTEITAAYVVDDNSGINAATIDGSAAGEALYDLQGRKVNGTPARGIYVSGGKKIVVR